MTALAIVAAALVLAVAVCVRQIRRLNRDVTTLYAKTRALEGGTTPPPSTDTDTRLRALEAVERRRDQAQAERSRP